MRFRSWRVFLIFSFYDVSRFLFFPSYGDALRGYAVLSVAVVAIAPITERIGAAHPFGVFACLKVSAHRQGRGALLGFQGTAAGFRYGFRPAC